MKVGDYADVHFTGRITRIGAYTAMLTVDMPSGLEPVYIVPIESITLAFEVDEAADRADEKRLKAAGQ